jgi:hypothetical protein
MYNEDKDYNVKIIITLETRVSFASMNRDRKIDTLDAIDNAIGSMPLQIWDQLEDGFGGEYLATFKFEVQEVV